MDGRNVLALLHRCLWQHSRRPQLSGNCVGANASMSCPKQSWLISVWPRSYRAGLANVQPRVAVVERCALLTNPGRRFGAQHQLGDRHYASIMSSGSSLSVQRGGVFSAECGSGLRCWEKQQTRDDKRRRWPHWRKKE